MVEIIEENVQPSFADKLFRGLGQAAQGAAVGIPMAFGQKMQTEKENEALKKMGIDLSGIADPETRKILLQGFTKKKQEDTNVKNQAIRSIGDMREIIKKGHTGLNIFNMITSEGRADRAALDTAALNLERLAADMVGKGTLSQQRFKYLKERLPSGFKTDAENEAILDEWEKILSEEESAPSKKKAAKTKFNPQNPEHKAKAEQLYKTYKNKDKVRDILKREFEGL